jgi:hypothetical protein
MRITGLAILALLFLGGVAEARFLKGKESNYSKYNAPTWGNRFKQTLINLPPRMQPYVRS